MRRCWPYPYVSHLLDLPPEVAELHFDLACLSLAADRRHSNITGRLLLVVPSGRLQLDGAARPVSGRRAYRPRRAVRGALHPVGWGSSAIAVDLELLPWSATRSELALIAGSVRWSGRVGERRYLRLAHDVLDVLVDAVHAAGDVDEASDKAPRVTTGARPAC